MANIGYKKREEKLRDGYRRGRELLKASKGKVFKGFAGIIQKNVYDPNWLHAEDWEKVAEMSEDDFVTYALRVKNGIRNAENFPIIEDDPKPLPGFENEPKPEPVQTVIDFDKERIADNLGSLIIIGRQVVEALNTIANAINTP